MRLMWPEKIVAVAAIFTATAMFLLWFILQEAAGPPFDIKLGRTAIYLALEAELMLVLPLWLILRLIYFIIANSRDRRDSPPHTKPTKVDFLANSSQKWIDIRPRKR